MTSYRRSQWSASLALALAAALLAGCGGGGGSSATTASTAPSVLPQEPGAPVMSKDIATDGFNWINYRRAQLGLSVLSHNTRIDAAAAGHSNYLRVNNQVTHEQTPGAPGFTGATLLARLGGAGYVVVKPYNFGEVISAASSNSGFELTEQLITAIYHRFLMFEPIYKEAGAGAATDAKGYSYFTCDLAANNGDGPGLGTGKLVAYPFDGQAKVPANFFSDNEEPDPVDGRNEVGYPISVHADYSVRLTVQSFSVAPRGGSALAVKLLSNAGDPKTPLSAAAIIPLNVLNANTTYDVQFSGMLNGIPVTRRWSFSTK